MRIIFTNPMYLWILLLLPILILSHLFVSRKRRPIAIKFSNYEALEKVSKRSYVGSGRGFLTKRDTLLILFRTLTYSLFILAISGIMVEYLGKVSNFDFVLAIDSSSSMLADDFEPSRLEAAKEAALLFTDSVARQTNIGVVSFAGDISTNLIPNKNIIQAKNKIKGIDIAETGGTNIGDALIASANLFEGVNPRSIVLLTDGQSNIGTPPMDAIGYLTSKNITVYTIGVATSKGGEVSEGFFVSKLDEETLMAIAEETNGKYYRAENKDVLKNIFEEIASSTVKETSLDLSWLALIMGFIVLAIGWLLVSTKYRILP